MDWNSTFVATTGSTSANSIIWTTAEAVAPTQMNVGSIENYLVSTNQMQAGNPYSTPGGIDEALAGKTIDQQVDLINQLSSVMDNTNTNTNYMDAWALQRSFQQQQQFQQQLNQQQQVEQQQQQEQTLSDRIGALEQQRNQQIINSLDNVINQDSNNWEEISYDERQEHWNEYNSTQEENKTLKARSSEMYKNNLALSWENDILKSTIGSLQWELKDTKSKLAYLESTANIVNDAQETKLLNLRRAAWENPWWAAELNYLNFLQQERQHLTGQDLSQNINDLYFQRVQEKARPDAADFEIPNASNMQPKANNDTEKWPGSFEDYLI